MVAFKAGVSPPAVRIPIRFILNSSLLSGDRYQKSGFGGESQEVESKKVL
jgi:hypothetical protein